MSSTPIITSESARLRQLIEALIFIAPAPMSLAQLMDMLPEGWDAGAEDIQATLYQLQEDYGSRGVQLVEVADKWQFRTAPELADMLKIERVQERKLSRAALETLAIVAYHQPVTRAEIEDIRGVSTSRGTLDILLEQGWVKPGRRRQTPGKPATWVTTEQFLSEFNLASLDDLPGLEELKASGMLEVRQDMLSLVERPNQDSEGDEEAAGDAEGDEENESFDFEPQNTVE